ncbi:MAG TPA: hypothetical protein DCW42_02755 [Bacteroidetes bacterium]|nr:hypothetical protein [Bacteroidota bacterium]
MNILLIIKKYYLIVLNSSFFCNIYKLRKILSMWKKIIDCYSLKICKISFSKNSKAQKLILNFRIFFNLLITKFATYNKEE